MNMWSKIQTACRNAIYQWNDVHLNGPIECFSDNRESQEHSLGIFTISSQHYFL